MTPRLERRLRNLFLLLIVAGIVLLILANARALPQPPPAAAGGSPREARGFVVYASTNGTGNKTGNATQNHTADQIWAQINLLWGQLNAPGGVWFQLSSLSTMQFVLIVGEVVLGLFLMIGFVLNARFVRTQIKALKDERIGPEDPNLYALLEPLLEKVLGPELGDYFDEKAKEDVMRRIRAKMKSPRLPVPGTAGHKRRPGTADE